MAITAYCGGNSSYPTTVDASASVSYSGDNATITITVTGTLLNGQWVQSSGIMFASSCDGQSKGNTSLFGNTEGGAKHEGTRTATHSYTVSRKTARNVSWSVTVYNSYDMENCGTAGTLSGTVALTASIKYYTVTFNLNGGTRTGGGALSQTVQGGGSATAPTVSRSGYTLAGWDKSLTNIQADTTITAKWVANKYTIPFDLNGGEGSFSSFQKTHGVAYTLPSTVPTKVFTVTFDPNGGTCSTKSLPAPTTFKCWQSSATGYTYSAGSAFDENALTTLKALYDLGSVGTLPVPTRTGFNFLGWKLAVDQIYLRADTLIEANTTARAQWEGSFEISFEQTGDTSISDIQYDSGTGVTLPSTVPVKHIYISYEFVCEAFTSANITETRWLKFLGWNTKKDGSGTMYQPSQHIDGTADITLYGQFEGVNPNIPSFSSDMATLKGWYPDPKRQDVPVVTKDTKINESIILYAQYSEFIVILKEPSGEILLEGSSDDPKTEIRLTKKPGTDLIIPNYIAYRYTDESETQGESFKGWATNRSASSPEYVSGSKYTKDEPATLYAIYGVTQHTVKWSVGYGANPIIKTEIVDHGASATPPKDPTRDGYTFAGWLGEYKSVKADRTILALWASTPIWIWNGKTWIGYEPEEV